MMSKRIIATIALVDTTIAFCMRSSPVVLGQARHLYQTKRATAAPGLRPWTPSLFDQYSVPLYTIANDVISDEENEIDKEKSTSPAIAEPVHTIKSGYAQILQASSDAQDLFATKTQKETDKIFTEIAKAANKARVPLAEMAVEETGMGCFEDKVIKNSLACELIHDRYKDSKTCGLISRDDHHGLRTYASPVGPVCAITPVTNPTSTALAKCLMLAKTRNAGVFLPHPRAAKCTAEAVRICREAGENVGAPENWVQCITDHNLEDSKSIMQSDEIKLILSTGGPAMVKASYSAGKPAIGVGSGNAPILVDETADVLQACGSIIMGKTFDNGVICAAEQSVVAVGGVYNELKELMILRGVHFLMGNERDKLATFIEKHGRINPDIVGQTPEEIARRAGLDLDQIPTGTVVLATEETTVGEDNPLSKEKLSPVIALYKTSTFDDGVQMCRSLALNGGVGHSAGLYTSTLDPEEAQRREELFLTEVPVHRVIVNAPTSMASIGTSFNFAIDPSLTLGVGTSAGSSISSNLGPQHLINLSIVAERQEHIEWLKLPQQLYFNRGCMEEALKGNVRGEKRALVVTDKGMVRSGILQRVLKCLRSEGLDVEVFSNVHPDPDEECIRNGVEVCDAFQPDIIVCVGGGSPIDAGKFIRAKYEHPGLTLEDASTRFIEIRKRTSPFPSTWSKVKKLIAIPTTSGTGSEVSPFTVVTSDEGKKYPIASYRLTPDVAICDSTLCDSLPRSLVAHAGLDSITHAVESFVSVAQNDFTKTQSLEALHLLFKYLPESYASGSARSRDACHRGATIAGIAFSNSFLGICHSLAHQLGAKFHLPHGMTCAILLPHVIDYNASESPTKMGIYPSYYYPQAADRYAAIAKHVGASTFNANGLIKLIHEIMIKLDTPLTFQDAGVDESDFLDSLEMLSKDAFDDQCTAANPRYPLVSELKDILLKSYYGAEAFE